MNADRASSLFWLVLAGFFIYRATTEYGLGTLGEPGTGFFSFLSGCFVALMAVLVFIGSFFKGYGLQTQIPSLWHGTKWHRTIEVCFLSLGYVLTFERLGFFLTTILFLLILCKWVQEFSWWKSIIIAIVASTLINLLFRTLLKASLPAGIFGF